MDWTACTMEPNAVLRWLECHLAAATVVAGFISAIAVGAAALMPLLHEKRLEKRHRTELVRRAASVVRYAQAQFEIVLRLRKLDEYQEYARGEEAPHLRIIGMDLDAIATTAGLPFSLTNWLVKIRAGVAGVTAQNDAFLDWAREPSILAKFSPGFLEQAKASATAGYEACTMWLRRAKDFAPIGSEFGDF